MTRTRANTAFTLIEVMIVVALIAIIATAAVPNLMKGLKDQPLVAAVHQVKDIFQYAKYKAVNDRNAYGVRVSDITDGESGGVIEVFRGNGPHCGGVDVVGTAPIRSMEANSIYADGYGVGTDIPVVAITSTHPSAPFSICYTPDGRMIDMATRQPVTSPIGATGAGEAVLTLQQTLNGTPVSSKHNVLVTYTGKPRVLFGEIEDADGEGGT